MDEPAKREYDLAPEVERPERVFLPLSPASSGPENFEPPPEERQLTLKQLAMVTALVSLLMAPAQWLSPAEYAGLMGMVSLVFLIVAGFSSLRRSVVLLISALLLLIYVATSLIAAWEV